MQNRRAPRFRRHLPWAAAWALVSLLAALILGQREISHQRDLFDADLHRVHGLLSQKLQHNDTLLTSLASLSGAPAESRSRTEQRLLQSPQAQPQVITLLKRDIDAVWADEALKAAESESAATSNPGTKAPRAVMANINLAGTTTPGSPPRARYFLVLASEPTALALQLDLRAQIPWSEWPMARESSPVQVRLEYERQMLTLQDGDLPEPGARGWLLDYRRGLDSASQPFVLTAQRHLAWRELPWSVMLNIALGVALLLLAARALLRQRHDMARARELVHMGEVGRLTTMNELAAGIAKELGAPVNAALAAASYARTQLSDDNQEPLAALASVDTAMDQLKAANNVVTRLRHVVEQPELAHQLERISLLDAARVALDLLQPELTRHHVRPRLDLTGPDFSVLAEKEALQQILFQLITNALQAMENMRPQDRQLSLIITSGLPGASHMGMLTVQDNGPGIANNIATQIFEPFFTTRPGHLGLGLSQCETLASSMGGTLTAFNRVPRGAEFCLSLRMAG